MKKLSFILSALLIVGLLACNNSANEAPAKDAKQAEADSLENEVMEGHNVGMAKMHKIANLKAETQRLIDSIDKLPAKARQAAASYKINLESLKNDLTKAGDAMNQWMENFKLDSAKSDLEKRIKYLTDEKLKVGNVKESILQSLQKADSLIKAKI